MSVFDIILNKFFKNLVDKYQYNLKNLETEWNFINEEMKSNINYDISFKANLESQNTTTSTSVELVVPPSTPISTIDTLTEELNNMSISPPDEKCPYKITRGTHANTVCNSKVKPGHIVCTKHIKYEEALKKVQAGGVTTSTSNTHDKSKPRLKLTSKQVSNQPYKLDFLNTCKSLEEEGTCINFDELQVHEINKMFKELVDANGNEYKDKNLTLEEIFLDKKKKLVEYYKEKAPLKITFTKWNQIEHSLNDVVSFRTKNDVILNLVRYKQSKYFVDKNSLVIVKSMDEPVVIGRINRYEQPTLEIDGYTYDLILKYNFEFDPEYLNNEGKEAHEAFLKSKTKTVTPLVDNSIPEENKNF